MRASGPARAGGVAPGDRAGKGFESNSTQDLGSQLFNGSSPRNGRPARYFAVPSASMRGPVDLDLQAPLELEIVARPGRQPLHHVRGREKVDAVARLVLLEHHELGLVALALQIDRVRLVASDLELRGRLPDELPVEVDLRGRRVALDADVLIRRTREASGREHEQRERLRLHTPQFTAPVPAG